MDGLCHFIDTFTHKMGRPNSYSVSKTDNLLSSLSQNDISDIPKTYADMQAILHDHIPILRYKTIPVKCGSDWTRFTYLSLLDQLGFAISGQTFRDT